MAVYAIADLHCDYPENKRWVEALRGDRDGALLVAGDVSNSLATLEWALRTLLAKYASVWFVPGNHELWVDEGDPAIPDSVRKFEAVLALCARLGVHTAPGTHADAWTIVPLFAWYSMPPARDSLWMPAAPGVLLDGERFWTDSWRCKWPAGALADDQAARAQYFVRLNDPAVRELSAQQTTRRRRRMVSFSHFFSHDEQLEMQHEIYRRANRERWGADDTGRWPNFSTVAGTALLGAQIDALHPDIHVFGHSHRGRDYVGKSGVRFVNPPLGYPREREMGRCVGVTEPLCISSD